MTDNPFADFLDTLDYSGLNNVDDEYSEIDDEIFEQRDRINLIIELMDEGALEALDGSTDAEREAWESFAKEAVTLFQRGRLPDGFGQLGPYYLLSMEQLYVTCVTAITLSRPEIDAAAVDLSADAACQNLKRNKRAGQALARGEMPCSINLIKTLTMQANYVYTRLVQDDSY